MLVQKWWLLGFVSSTEDPSLQADRQASFSAEKQDLTLCVDFVQERLSLTNAELS